MINNNIVNVASSNGNQYGIQVPSDYTDLNLIRAQIIGNRINITGTTSLQSWGINCLSFYGSSSNARNLWNIVANNFISQSGGTGQFYGMYFNQTGYSDIVYNSINITAGASNSFGMYFDGTSYSTTYMYTMVNNNAVSNTGGGYAIGVNNVYTPVSVCNYNDYYVTGTYLGQWNTTNCISLSNWRTASGGFDLNSIPLIRASQVLLICM
jgi:hypothetical protein